MIASVLSARILCLKVSKTHMGGTMRLGARKTLLQTADCITAKLYVFELIRYLVWLFSLCTTKQGNQVKLSVVSSLVRFELCIISCYRGVLHPAPLCVTSIIVPCRYQKESFLDERHRHRYEVNIIHKFSYVRLYSLGFLDMVLVESVSHEVIFLLAGQSRDGGQFGSCRTSLCWQGRDGTKNGGTISLTHKSINLHDVSNEETAC